MQRWRREGCHNVDVRLTVSASVHAVLCESVCQANEVLLFGSSNTLLFKGKEVRMSLRDSTVSLSNITKKLLKETVESLRLMHTSFPFYTTSHMHYH